MKRLMSRSSTFDRPTIIAIAVLLLVVSTQVFAQEEAANVAPKVDDEVEAERAWVIHVPLPITGRVFDRVKRAVTRAEDKAAADRARPTFVLEFAVRSDEEQHSRGSEFGASLDLAKFLTSGRLAAARTIAFVPRTIEGHAVLPVLACEEIIMAPNADIGRAGVDEEYITETIRSAYEEIADRRRTVPGAVAIGLVDSEREIMKVETEIGTVYTDRKGYEEIRRKQVVLGEPETLTPPFSGVEFRQQGFASYLAEDLNGVADALQMPRRVLEEDPSLDADWSAVRIDVVGPVAPGSAEGIIAQINKAVDKNGANFVCVWIDSPGGDLAASSAIADHLANFRERNEVRSVAYIPGEALADAAIIAMACDEIVAAPRARIGGEGAEYLAPEDVEVAVTTIRSIATVKDRSWSLPAAMVDPNIEVFRFTRKGDPRLVEFFTEEEWNEQSAPEEWEQGERVTTPGRDLQISGDQGVDCGIVEETVSNFAQFKQRYGLEDDPSFMQPGWADTLIRALASPGMAGVLLLIGFLALYAEMKAPGVGIGGFISAMCFVLFFWSRFLDGTAGWLEVLLFMLGVCCLLLEIFVLPGFGIFGLGGGMLILASIVLAGQTFIVPRNAYQFGQFQNSLVLLSLSGLSSLLLVISFGHWLQKLYAPSAEERAAQSEREKLVDYDAFLGQTGRTTTRLCPSGKARIGDTLIDVMADCELVDAGVDIEVVLVQGNRVFVRPVDPTG